MHDFVTDQNPVPIYDAAEMGLPDYAQVEVMTSESLAHLPNSAFAESTKRLFPLHTKAAALLSAVYFHGKQMSDRNVEAKINRAVNLFKIESDVEKFAAARQVKAAAATEGKFALTIAGVPGSDGEKKAHFYPINSRGEVVLSAEQVSSEYALGQIPCEWYHPAAREIIKAAKAFGVGHDELPEAVWTDGEPRYPDFEFAGVMANLRKEAGISEEALEIYHELIKSAEADYKTNPDSLDSWIDLWVDLDRTNGVKYSRLIADPYRAFYSAGQPEAEVEKMSKELVSIADVFVPAVVLASWSADRRAEIFDKTASSVIASAQQIAIENPIGAGELLDNLKPAEKLELLRSLSIGY